MITFASIKDNRNASENLDNCAIEVNYPPRGAATGGDRLLSQTSFGGENTVAAIVIGKETDVRRVGVVAPAREIIRRVSERASVLRVSVRA